VCENLKSHEKSLIPDTCNLLICKVGRRGGDGKVEEEQLEEAKEYLALKYPYVKRSHQQ
jgi:hypothetical protein